MRMRGHSEHDDFKYVPPALIEAWKHWDPVTRMAAYLEGRGVGAEALRALETNVAAEIDAAEKQARTEPSPVPESAKEGVYRRWDDEWTVPAGRLGDNK